MLTLGGPPVPQTPAPRFDVAARNAETPVALPRRSSQIPSTTNGKPTIAVCMPNLRITADPRVMMGKPRIKGTRVTVELILRKLGAGRSFADLIGAYPQLTEEDLQAALTFAADYLQHETVLAAE